MNNISNFLKKYYYTKILKRNYFRYGSCKKCGACCKNIYIRHKNNVIKSKEEFITLKNNDDYPFWKNLEIIGKDELGVVFKCKLFDEEKSLCKKHKKRPDICRKYPSEEIFKMGAILKEECGYYFKPIESFREILDRISVK